MMMDLLLCELVEFDSFEEGEVKHFFGVPPEDYIVQVLLVEGEEFIVAGGLSVIRWVYFKIVIAWV
jgi:hypothetical protein